MKEIWKDIIGYEGYYQVSNLGNVRSLDRDIQYSNGGIYHYEGKILSGFVKQNGYRSVDLYKNNKKKRFHVHRLVAEAFIENPLNKLEVNHINEDKSDNRAENLEWCTSSENKLAGTVIERANKTRKDKKVGYKQVAMYDLDGNLLQTFENIDIAVKSTGINRKSIYNSCNNKVNPKKYIWKYVA